jgi:hypothetical protein
LHLGQIVWREGWRLIDIDDLGLGDPAWDLARPAALYAAGILEQAEWLALLKSYLEAGGMGVPPRDPWSVLEVPARALVVQMAARAIALTDREQRSLDQSQEALIAACGRIATRRLEG